MKPLLLIAAVVVSGCSPLSDDDLKDVAGKCKGVVTHSFSVNPFWQTDTVSCSVDVSKTPAPKGGE